MLLMHEITRLKAGLVVGETRMASVGVSWPKLATRG
jgi:hypothetical protein